MFRSQKFSLQTASRLVFSAALVLVAIALVSLPAAAQKATPTNLTSDITDVGTFMDANLVNPWGLVASPAGPWWISDNGTGLSTLYDGTGKPQALWSPFPSGTVHGTGTPTGNRLQQHVRLQDQWQLRALYLCHGRRNHLGLELRNQCGNCSQQLRQRQRRLQGIGPRISRAASTTFMWRTSATVRWMSSTKTLRPFSFGSGSFVDPHRPRRISLRSMSPTSAAVSWP